MTWIQRRWVERAERPGFDASQHPHHLAPDEWNFAESGEAGVANVSCYSTVGLEKWRQQAAGDAVEAGMGAAPAGVVVECGADRRVLVQATAEDERVDEGEIGALAELWTRRTRCVTNEGEAVGIGAREPDVGVGRR